MELLRLIWRTDIEEDEDPTTAISKMREAFNDLSTNSSSTFDDNALAYAILMALPLSYSTLVQTLTLRPTISSADVITATIDEYR